MNKYKRLVYKIVNNIMKNNINYNREDLYSWGLIGLCKALNSKTYKGDKNKIKINYLASSIYREIIDNINKDKNKVEVISLDYVIDNLEYKEALSIDDKIDLEITIKNIYKSNLLSQQDKIILNLYLKGYNLTQISKLLKEEDPQIIQRRFKKMISKIKEYVKNE